MTKLEILAYGSLHQAVREAVQRLQGLTEEHSLPVREVLDRLGLSREQVQLVMLNHSPACLEDQVCQGDRLALFPQEYPVFTDWKDYRQA
ncbi:MAG: hypothetical protein R6U22_08080 [Desulfohalobiaceae bacterium]|jgi:hypothetical protein